MRFQTWKDQFYTRISRNKPNEWYPRGIQISLHIRSPRLQAFRGGGEVGCQDLPKFQFRGGGRYSWALPSQNSKCQDLPKFQFGGGGHSQALLSQNSKCQDLPKFQCSGGGVLSGSAKSKLKVPRLFREWGHSRNFEPNFQPLQLATASQIVSHILRMWRLTKVTNLCITQKDELVSQCFLTPSQTDVYFFMWVVTV